MYTISCLYGQACIQDLLVSLKHEFVSKHGPKLQERMA